MGVLHAVGFYVTGLFPNHYYSFSGIYIWNNLEPLIQYSRTVQETLLYINVLFSIISCMLKYHEMKWLYVGVLEENE